MIPESWKDDKFNEDMKEAKIIRKIDIRPKFCGLAATPEVCEELGIPTFKEVTTFDYYDLFQACINLLDRRGMTSKINPVQELEDIDFATIEKDAVGKGNIFSE